MSTFMQTCITDAGLKPMARGVAGDKIEFAHISIGDGKPASIADMYKLSSLVHPIMDLKIVDAKADTEKETFKATAMFDNSSITDTFYYREIGLYARDPDQVDRFILYAYGNAWDLAEPIKPAGTSSVIEKTVSVSVAVGRATNVVARLDSEGCVTLAKFENLDKRKAELDPETGKVKKEQLPAFVPAGAAENKHVFRTITLLNSAWSVPISGEAIPVTAGEMEVMPAAATGSAGDGAAGFAQVAPVSEIIKTDDEESWVWVTPVDDEANLIAIEDAFVRPTEIGNGTLTFAADSLPAAAVGFVVEVGGTGERSAQ